MPEPTPAGAESFAAAELPDDPVAARDFLMAELEQARADLLELSATAVPREQADEYLDDLQRVAADFENFRKRTERDLLENADRASQRVVQSLLPVLDSFDLAVAQEPANEEEATLLKGVLGTRQQLLDTLAKEGLEPIASLGEVFDPEVHEAARVIGDADPLIVLDEMRRGYRLGGRVIRAALVVVGDGSEENEADDR